MSDFKTALRATPAPLLVAFVIWPMFSLVRFGTVVFGSIEKSFSANLLLTGEGVGFACQLFVLCGVLELVRRSAGLRRGYLIMSLVGISIVVGSDLVAGLNEYTKDSWSHEWVYKAWDYAAVLGYNLFAFGLVKVLPPARRTLGFVALGIAFVGWLPAVLREPLFEALKLHDKPGIYIDFVLRLLRMGALLWLSINASEGETTRDQLGAAQGFRSAGKALWIRVIAALVVVLFGLLMLGTHSAAGARSLLKVIMMGQGIFGVIALTLFGLACLRIARAGQSELSPFALTLGGGASLWGAGVSLAQLPYLYRVLYGDFGGHSDADRATALTLATPLIVVLGVGLVATALASFASRRGDEELRSDAQGKGAGYVALMLTSIAIQNWLVTKAETQSSYAMMMLAAGVAGLWATAVIAKLFTRAADQLEQEPGLPAASIVSDAPVP